MVPWLRKQKPEVQAAIAGIGFAVLQFSFGQLDRPWRVLAGAAVFALVIWAMAQRRKEGKPEAPPKVAIAFSIFALGLYTWGFFIASSPSGWQWIAVVLIFMFPLLAIWQAYQNSHRLKRG